MRVKQVHIAILIVIGIMGLLIVAAVMEAKAQNGANSVTYRLSPEASKEYIDHEKQIQSLQSVIANLRLQQQLMLADAGVPKAERDRPVHLVEGTIVLPPRPKVEQAKAKE